MNNIEKVSHAPSHGIVENWLGPSAAGRLWNCVTNSSDIFEASKVGFGALDETRRRSTRCSLNERLHREMTHVAAGLLSDMCNHLRIKEFKPTDIELEFAIHRDGDFFSRHVDSEHGLGTSRIITAIYYCHPPTARFSGGVLKIFKHSTNFGREEVAEILPDSDTLAFFPSALPHEVTRVIGESSSLNDARVSLNIWFHGLDDNCP